MRRILSLILIVASSWMLYKALAPLGDIGALHMTSAISYATSDTGFMVAFLGGALGLIGGITAFLGGAGGATIALCGGLIAAGSAILSGHSMAIPETRSWDDDVLVAIGLVAIAAWAALARPSNA